MVADIDCEVSDKVIVGHMRHVEPGVGVKIVGQLHHVFDRHAVDDRLTWRALEAGTLAHVERVTAVAPRADIGGIGFLQRHEADRIERLEPLEIQRMKR